MVLLGLVAVIVAIVLVVVRPGASQGDEVTQSVPPTTPATGRPASDAPATDAARTRTRPSRAAGGARRRRCGVHRRADHRRGGHRQAGLRSRRAAELSVTITNTGANTCVLNVGTAAQVFTVSSGKETYWKSTDCQVDAVDAQVLLEPNTPVSSTAPIVWDRTRSNADTCGGERTAAPAAGASYHLTVAVSGFESDATKQFLLY